MIGNTNFKLELGNVERPMERVKRWIVSSMNHGNDTDLL